MRTQLLCTFTNEAEFESVLQNIKDSFILYSRKIFILKLKPSQEKALKVAECRRVQSRPARDGLVELRLNQYEYEHRVYEHRRWQSETRWSSSAIAFLQIRSCLR